MCVQLGWMLSLSTVQMAADGPLEDETPLDDPDEKRVEVDRDADDAQEAIGRLERQRIGGTLTLIGGAALAEDAKKKAEVAAMRAASRASTATIMARAWELKVAGQAGDREHVARRALMADMHDFLDNHNVRECRAATVDEVVLADVSGGPAMKTLEMVLGNDPQRIAQAVESCARAVEQERITIVISNLTRGGKDKRAEAIQASLPMDVLSRCKARARELKAKRTQDEIEQHWSAAAKAMVVAAAAKAAAAVAAPPVAPVVAPAPPVRPQGPVGAPGKPKSGSKEKAAGTSGTAKEEKGRGQLAASASAPSPTGNVARGAAAGSTVSMDLNSNDLPDSCLLMDISNGVRAQLPGSTDLKVDKGAPVLVLVWQNSDRSRAEVGQLHKCVEGLLNGESDKMVETDTRRYDRSVDSRPRARAHRTENVRGPRQPSQRGVGHR